MRWFAAASLALFLTLSLVATAQVQGMPITPNQRMQLGTATGSVRAGSSLAFQGGGTFFGPSTGFRNPNAPFYRHNHARTFGYVWPYGSYYYGAYVPYTADYDADPAYTSYVPGTFNSSQYPGDPYPPQYTPQPNYYPPDSPPPPVNSTPESQDQMSNPRTSQSDSASDQFTDPTVLVFRDGHQQEVANYAIMGSTLFVLSGPRSRIPIAQLDIPATEQVNQSRGVDFHVPEKTQ
jgi:hypothetical protein